MVTICDHALWRWLCDCYHKNKIPRHQEIKPEVKMDLIYQCRTMQHPSLDDRMWPMWPFFTRWKPHHPIKISAVSLGCCRGTGCFAVVVAGLCGAFPKQMLRKGDVYIYSTIYARSPCTEDHKLQNKGWEICKKPMGICWYTSNLLGI